MTAAEILIAIAPSTNRPISVGLTRFATTVRRGLRVRAVLFRLVRLAFLAASQEAMNLRIVAEHEQILRRSPRDLRARLGVEKDRIVADREDARELVRDDDDGRAETVAEL